MDVIFLEVVGLDWNELKIKFNFIFKWDFVVKVVLGRKYLIEDVSILYFVIDSLMVLMFCN